MIYIVDIRSITIKKYKLIVLTKSQVDIKKQLN